MDLTLSDEHRQLGELVPALGEVGFLGLGIDEPYGGSGGDNLAYCLVLKEVARGDSTVRGNISVSLGLVAKSIAKHGTWADVALVFARTGGPGPKGNCSSAVR